MSRSQAHARPLAAPADPVWEAAMNAPLDDEPETDEERRAVAAAKAEVKAGAPMRPAADVTAAIAAMRDK